MKKKTKHIGSRRIQQGDKMEGLIAKGKKYYHINIEAAFTINEIDDDSISVTWEDGKGLEQYISLPKDYVTVGLERKTIIESSTLDRQKEALAAAIESLVKLADPDRNRFPVITPEQARVLLEIIPEDVVERGY